VGARDSGFLVRVIYRVVVFVLSSVVVILVLIPPHPWTFVLPSTCWGS
jgi:uncharacterized membrane protein YccC